MTSPGVLPEILCQQALARVLTYLANDGTELTADTCRQALRLVESELAVSSGRGVDPDLPARCFNRIPDYFDCSTESVPNANPPLNRGCIGYE